MNTVHGTPLAQPVTQTQLVEAPQPMSVPKAYEQSCSVQPWPNGKANKASFTLAGGETALVVLLPLPPSLLLKNGWEAYCHGECKSDTRSISRSDVLPAIFKGFFKWIDSTAKEKTNDCGRHGASQPCQNHQKSLCVLESNATTLVLFSGMLNVDLGFQCSNQRKNYWSGRDQRDLYRSIDSRRLILETVAVSVLYYPKLAISVIFTHLTKVLFLLTKNTHAWNSFMSDSLSFSVRSSHAALLLVPSSRMNLSQCLWCTYKIH